MKYYKNLNTTNFSLKDFDDKLTNTDICKRVSIDYDKITKQLTDIREGVLKRGDEYIKQLTLKFDGVDIDQLKVSDNELKESESLVSDEFKKSIKKAYQNIYKFHSRQVRDNLVAQETSSGVYCYQEFKPIEKVGFYIPGGTAALFSTVLMLGIPANIAGCKDIVLCTPPNKEAKISPEILYTASLLGINKIYKIGGAQAIFAMGYGTKQVPKVYKIFGPGNAFVTGAKMIVSREVAIDMPAGPSEVLVLADSNANPIFVASDLLSQAEHGKDSQVVLVSDCEDMIRKVFKEINIQVKELPRKEIIEESLKNSFVVFVDNIKEGIEFSNLYAPEHLILQIENFEKYLSDIVNAGSVFCGPYSPESAGDYMSGTNHTLPTSAFSRSYSGVGVESFGKWISFQRITKEGLKEIGKDIELLASLEGLDAHKKAVSLRLIKE